MAQNPTTPRMTRLSHFKQQWLTGLMFFMGVFRWYFLLPHSFLGYQRVNSTVVDGTMIILSFQRRKTSNVNEIHSGMQ